MNTKTQIEWTKSKLLNDGQVTRNEALQNYFSRLGARIKDLRDEGWEIEGEFVNTKFGRDYVYRLNSEHQAV